MTSLRLRRRFGVQLMLVTVVAQVLSMVAGWGPPLQPLLSVLVLLTVPGFVLFDYLADTDLLTRLVASIAASLATNVVIASAILLPDLFWILPALAVAAIGWTVSRIGPRALVFSTVEASARVFGRRGRSPATPVEKPALPSLALGDGDSPWWAGPEVSVVIPTRDRPELVREAIAAARSQEGLHPIEILVVYDQSEPDMGLQDLTATPPVRVIINTQAPGLAGARNSGILASTGDWIAFCDDDDTWSPDKLARQSAALARSPGADFVVGGVTVAFGDKRIARGAGCDLLTFDALLTDRVMAAHPSTFLVRRSAIDDYIGLVDEELPGSYAEDYDWLLRAARVRPILVAQDADTMVRWHPKSYFGNRWAMIDDALACLVDKTPEFSTNPRGLARILGQRAIAQAALGRRRDALSTTWSAWKLDRRQPRAYIAPLIAWRVVSADRLVRWANSVGRGF